MIKYDKKNNNYEKFKRLRKNTDIFLDGNDLTTLSKV